MDIIAQFFACFSQKLAPARKNSTNWLARLARFCNSGFQIYKFLKIWRPCNFSKLRTFGLVCHLKCPSLLLYLPIFHTCDPGLSFHVKFPPLQAHNVVSAHVVLVVSCLTVPSAITRVKMHYRWVTLCLRPRVRVCMSKNIVNNRHSMYQSGVSECWYSGILPFRIYCSVEVWNVQKSIIQKWCPVSAAV